jgi:hypothetical protein
MGSIARLKRQAIEELLRHEDYIFLVINPLVPGVALPEYLIEGAQPVPINIGYNMAVPIADLEIDDRGIFGTLSFNRSPFRCAFPWASLIQITVGDEHLVWVNAAEVPAELRPAEQRPAEQRPATAARKPHLRLVE